MATFECVFSGLDVLNDHSDCANVFGNINKIHTDLSTFQWKEFTCHFLPIKASAAVHAKLDTMWLVILKGIV